MQQKLVFVTGKGGVGKSAVAAAMASNYARLGKRTLLVEFGENSYFQNVYNLSAIGFKPLALGENFDVAQWTMQASLREYFAHYIRLETLLDLFFANPIMQSLINVAPGLNELALLGKATSGLRKTGPALEHDVVVIDCYATGHFLSLLRAPKAMGDAIRFGPMGAQSRDMQAVLADPNKVEYVLVALPEELPVAETIELHATLKTEFAITAQVFCNRVMQAPVEVEQLQSMMKTYGQQDEGLKHFSQFILDTHRRQHLQLNELQKQVGEVGILPLVLESQPRQVIHALAKALLPQMQEMRGLNNG